MATMVSSRLLLLYISTHFVALITAQPGFIDQICSNENYTTNSTYETNLDLVLSSISNLPSTAQYNGGFYNWSAGEDPDAVNAIALCRADMMPEACYRCLNDSRYELIKKCPNQKEAIGWYDRCMLRYSNRDIFGVMEFIPISDMWNPLNVTTDVDKYNEVLSNLLQGLANAAASGGSSKFATGNASAESFRTIYALVQCTPDLTQPECLNCLGSAFEEMADHFPGKMGGRSFTPSCVFQYEKFLFYDTKLAIPSTNNSTDTKLGNGDIRKSQSILVIVVPVAFAVVIAICISLGIFCIFLRLRKRMEKVEGNDSKGSEAVDEIKSVESLQFHFRTIRDATDNFSDAKKLGKGGFGAVYKGRLSGGQYIAVKRLSKDSGQGDFEFKNEVLLVAKLQHRNLVRLLGFCLESDERLLVYEFVPNKSLDYFIFDSVKRGQLDWEKRYKVIGGIARGLLYLHEDSRLRIIHRDLKASNILLDADMNPKISDFGTARLFIRDQTQGKTLRIVGTYGYMAPEYAMHGHFSVKSDVFSFGVLVLEIVSGHKNTAFHNEEGEDLLNYAWRNWKEGTALNVIDPTLRNGSNSEMMRCIHIALLCIQNNLSDRPTMTSVALMLNSNSLTLPLPSQPVYFKESIMVHIDFSSSSQEQTLTVGESDPSRSRTVHVYKNM